MTKDLFIAKCAEYASVNGCALNVDAAEQAWEILKEDMWDFLDMMTFEDVNLYALDEAVNMFVPGWVR